jgi:dihydroxyacetone kinase
VYKMSDTKTISREEVLEAVQRVAAAVQAQYEHLTKLDQALGDGDLGITAKKIAAALNEYVAASSSEDLGKFIASAGMAVNRAASSTMGTLLATALMRAGKEIRGLDAIDGKNLAAMLKAADLGIQERGKAKPGDKTIVDALHPATEAFNSAINDGDRLELAAEKMIDAAQAGLEYATSLKSRIGRASWIGERTVGQIDPGCSLLIIILKAVMNK